MERSEFAGLILSEEDYEEVMHQKLFELLPKDGELSAVEEISSMYLFLKDISIFLKDSEDVVLCRPQNFGNKEVHQLVLPWTPWFNDEEIQEEIAMLKDAFGRYLPRNFDYEGHLVTVMCEEIEKGEC